MPTIRFQTRLLAGEVAARYLDGDEAEQEKRGKNGRA